MRAPMVIEHCIVFLTHCVEPQTLFIKIILCAYNVRSWDLDQWADVCRFQPGVAIVIPRQRSAHEDGAAEEAIRWLQWMGGGAMNQDRCRQGGTLREAYDAVEWSFFLDHRQDQLLCLGEFFPRRDLPVDVEGVIAEIRSVEEPADAWGPQN